MSPARLNCPTRQARVALPLHLWRRGSGRGGPSPFLMLRYLAIFPVGCGVGPQSLREGVGRAVLCTPKRRLGCTAACRGLPALPAVTDPLRCGTNASGVRAENHGLLSLTLSSKGGEGNGAATSERRRSEGKRASAARPGCVHPVRHVTHVTHATHVTHLTQVT